MKPTHRLWRWLGLVFVLSFGALGYLGWQIYLTAPPIPKSIATTDGEVLFTGEQIQLGQQAWMSAGGQQLGTVWGHGSYVAPDWSADWLHREATALGLDCAVEVRNEDDLEQALERIDPEIFLLSPSEGDDDETPLEIVLDLLAAVPAGKLAIADLPLVTPRETEELELAGCDAVIVATGDIAAMAGDLPPDV